jgi:hypothetical protein
MIGKIKMPHGAGLGGDPGPLLFANLELNKIAGEDAMPADARIKIRSPVQPPP